MRAHLADSWLQSWPTLRYASDYVTLRLLFWPKLRYGITICYILHITDIFWFDVFSIIDLIVLDSSKTVADIDAKLSVHSPASIWRLSSKFHYIFHSILRLRITDFLDKRSSLFIVPLYAIRRQPVGTVNIFDASQHMVIVTARWVVFKDPSRFLVRSRVRSTTVP